MSREYTFEGDGYICTFEVLNDPDPEKVNDGASKFIKAALKRGVDVDAIDREQRQLQSQFD